eukprot:1077470-Amphidinium_carterae.2
MVRSVDRSSAFQCAQPVCHHAQKESNGVAKSLCLTSSFAVVVVEPPCSAAKHQSLPQKHLLSTCERSYGPDLDSLVPVPGRFNCSQGSAGLLISALIVKHYAQVVVILQ